MIMRSGKTELFGRILATVYWEHAGSEEAKALGCRSLGGPVEELLAMDSHASCAFEEACLPDPAEGNPFCTHPELHHLQASFVVRVQTSAPPASEEGMRPHCFPSTAWAVASLTCPDVVVVVFH
jgi:hypothetical protein